MAYTREADLSSLASVDELDELERQLETALSKVRSRKDELPMNLTEELHLKINWSRRHDAAATGEEGMEEMADVIPLYEAASNTQLERQLNTALSKVRERKDELLMNLKDELQLKVELKWIQKRVSRQVTFSKRRQGLLKKAHELAVLCDVDVGVGVFSEHGKLQYPDPPASLADVIRRYEAVTNTQLFQQIHCTDDQQQQMIVEIGRLRHEYEQLEANLTGQADLLSLASVDELERQLEMALSKVRSRKDELLMSMKDELELKINWSWRHGDAAATGEEGIMAEQPPPSLPYLLNVKEKAAASTMLRQLCPQMAGGGRTRAVLAVLLVAALMLPLAAAMDASLEVTAASSAPAKINQSTPAAAPAQMVFLSSDHKESSRNGKKTGIIVLCSLAGAYVVMLLGVCLIRRWRERRQQRAARAAQDAATRAAQDATRAPQDARRGSVAKVSIVPYEPAAAGAKAADELECYVCLEEYVRGDEIGVLPCTHRFHARCIRRWIVDGVTATCPRCREAV